jgi:hypothetical protein
VTAEYTERRRSVRLPLTLAISGKTVEGLFRSHSFTGETENISFDGLCINTNMSNGFGRDKRIKFKTQLYRGDFLLKAIGVVRWVDRQHEPEGPIRMGVALEKVAHYRHWSERIEEELEGSV